MLNYGKRSMSEKLNLKMDYIIVNFLIRILQHDDQCKKKKKNSENKVKQDRLRIPQINIVTTLLY
jgi:hypothetical protein